ncbi:kinesin-like protein KIF20A [Acipenser oxyrinchus oxyrinchus]|uniref:Kinesin-like protein n=1 Tax=Acipenser oxyrinchus oxyrinchus TaxID=40147 RepID=A0AAD8DDN5_ACIOX|nr:kinesin-like protein KIF20A [Acipenser oxyrinchus oxyrinchus]
MESTPCELNVDNLHKGVLSELSTISSVSVSAQVEQADHAEQRQLRVYLRVRPFSKEELANDEDQGCIVLENAEVAVLQAPKESSSMKNSEKGVGQSIHKFSFSQIFGPDTTQTDFFKGTVRELVYNYLDGGNALVFTYGVTNAGKTHTIQGSENDGGILPRSLDVIFNHVKGRQYQHMDFKPHLSSDVQYLDSNQVKQEKSAKAAVFAMLKEENDRSTKSNTSAASHASLLKSTSNASLSFSSVSYDQTVEADSSLSGGEPFQFAVWVSFCEIYNESVYDLMEPLPTSRNHKRNALRVCEDHSGNSYVRDLKWINIFNTEEACKILKIGNKNRSAACTRMNQTSSRSHGIFSVKLLRIDGTQVQKISELSLCDLAGSERCNKTKTFGERLKEAGNINNSLLILGKCIAALRQNQNPKVKNNYVPFRESKLTRLFQSIFCGKGRACMIVNINQCASTFDETLHVMKFSAVAKQVVQVIQPKPLASIAPRLVGKDGKMLLRHAIVEEEAMDSLLLEEELLDEEDSEADMSILPQEELLNIIESLKEKLVEERRKNLKQEIEIRREMGNAMLEQLMENEENWDKQVEELKESYEEKLENTFDMYKDAIKQHAYQRAMEDVEDNYVPIEEFLAEQEKVMELERKYTEMELNLKAFQRNPSEAESMDGANSLQSATLAHKSEVRYKELWEANSSSEKLCEEKDQVIKSMEKTIKALNEAIQEAGDNFLEKVEENKRLEEKIAQQEEEMKELHRSCTAQEALLSELRVQFETSKKCTQGGTGEPKAKKGILANLRATVGSPAKLSKKTVAGTSSSTRKRGLFK